MTVSGSGQPPGPEVTRMARRVQRSLVLLGLFLTAMVAVASGTALPDGRPAAGYARLLEGQGPLPTYQESLLADCRMEEARLRAEADGGVIPPRLFEELLTFCHEAARLDARSTGIASADQSAWEQAAARERVRERHRQAMRELQGQTAGPDMAAKP